MDTHHRVCFERLTQLFDTLFDHKFQEVDKLKLRNILIIQSKHGIIIDQKDHIIKKIIKDYLGTKAKERIKFQK